MRNLAALITILSATACLSPMALAKGSSVTKAHVAATAVKKQNRQIAPVTKKFVKRASLGHGSKGRSLPRTKA